MSKKGSNWGSTGHGGMGKAPSGQGYPGPAPKAGTSFKSGSVPAAPKPTDCCKDNKK